MPDEWWTRLKKRYEATNRLQRININTRIGQIFNRILYLSIISNFNLTFDF